VGRKRQKVSKASEREGGGMKFMVEVHQITEIGRSIGTENIEC